jgi:hypothetical protein
MDISKLARRPEIVRFELDDADFVETYGEPIVFFMLDHIGLGTYFDFHQVQQSRDDAELQAIFRKIIVREDGTPAIESDQVLPVNISLAILLKINQHLGKSEAQASTSKTGEQPK